MSDAFNLSMPWWEYLARACIVYFVLLLMIRVSGKRSMGQFTSFDMLLIVLLGNAVQNALLGTDNSVTGGLILAATLIVLNWSVGYLAARSAAPSACWKASRWCWRATATCSATCCGANW